MGNAEVPLRVAYAVPPPPDWRYRARQVLFALVRIQMSERQPALLVFNRVGVPHFLFSVPTVADAQQRLDRLGEELDSTGPAAFLERYRVPLKFIDATEPLPGKRNRLHPLL